MELAVGDVIDGKYRVVRHIGAGGMGTVYEGENVRIGRRVAIKVLHAQVASLPEFVQRFEREARAAARVGSPHVCDVLDLGDLPGGDRFIVMEYLEGVNLEDRLADKGRLSAAELAPIAFELLEGLGTMHAAGVIHRDLKPANVFLCRHPTGRGELVKILDFGVAKLQPLVGEVGSMTQTGAMMGTPLYMSPEQARGARDVDGRTDLYAASVIFYRALTGELPYTAETLNELLFKIVLEDPKGIRELAPEVDEAFAALVHRGLSRDADKRFATARAYQEAIATWGRAQGRSSLAFAVTLPSEPPPARRPSVADADPAEARTATVAGSATAASEPASARSGPTASASGKSATPKSEGPGSGVASSRPSDGTPTAWSEDAPPVGANAAALDVTAPSPGSAPAREPSVASAQTPASPERAPSVPSQRRTIALVATAAAALGFVALFVGARGAAPSAAAPTTTAPEPPPAEMPASTAPAEPATAAAAPPPATDALPEPPAPAASAAPAARKPPPASTTAPAAPQAPSKSEPAKPTAKAAPTTAGSTRPPSPAPAPSSSTPGRKFRTNLD